MKLEDMQLEMAIKQGYVPDTCLLDGKLVWALMNDGQDPCHGCNHDRTVCHGRMVGKKPGQDEFDTWDKERIGKHDKLLLVSINHREPTEFVVIDLVTNRVQKAESRYTKIIPEALHHAYIMIKDHKITRVVFEGHPSEVKIAENELEKLNLNLPWTAVEREVPAFRFIKGGFNGNGI